MVDQLSALQRRLVVAQSRPDEPWLTLVENFPEWPSHATPKERSGAGHGEISPYHYPPSEGLPELREAVALRESAESTGVLFDAANVLVTAGGLHAIGLAVRHCFADGYRVAVCSRPTFRGVHDSFVSAGLDVCTVDLTGTPEDWPVLDAACVARSVLYLNLPQNPTGIAPTEEFLAMLGHLVRTRDIFLLYDAVYDSFVFERWVCAAPVELAVDLPNVLIANSMSKNYGRPGDRIGWLIGHERTVARLAPRLEWEAVAINGRAQPVAGSLPDIPSCTSSCPRRVHNSGWIWACATSSRLPTSRSPSIISCSPLPRTTCHRQQGTSGTRPVRNRLSSTQGWTHSPSRWTNGGTGRSST